MVALGQALMSDPQVVLLDEPYAGLAPTMVDSINDSIQLLTANGVGVLVVDEVLDRALSQSSRCYVIESGQIVLEGASEVLARDKAAERIVVGLDSESSLDPAAGDPALAEHPYQIRRYVT
jgi:branched-chain amino acid transport system ATP-binding protein